MIPRFCKAITFNNVLLGFTGLHSKAVMPRNHNVCKSNYYGVTMAEIHIDSIFYFQTYYIS